MAEWSPPILGFAGSAADIARVVWRDGTAICGGILGNSAELAATLAALARKDELRRQPNVVLLEDFREAKDGGFV